MLGIEKLFLYERLNKSKLIGHLYVILAAPVTWVAFSITNVKRLWIYYTRMFPFLGKSHGTVMKYDYVKYLGEYGGLFLIAIMFATPIPLVFYNRMKRKPWTKELLNVILLLILGLCLYYMAISTNNPFLYFNF